MSKDQVSGSLTLSLSGLADAVAERVSKEIRAAVNPEIKVYDRDQVISLLTGFGLEYVVAAQIYGALVEYRLAVIALPDGMHHEPEPPVTPDTGSAEEWFRKEVGL